MIINNLCIWLSFQTHIPTNSSTHTHSFRLFNCNVKKMTSYTAACSTLLVHARLISDCVLFICYLPLMASQWLVSWTMLDTGGKRKCPHGWDQSTVLGVLQWPWRLIISPQKCSFMLLILCNSVSMGFLVKQLPPPNPPHTSPEKSLWWWVWSETHRRVITAALLSASETLIYDLNKGISWDTETELPSWCHNKPFFI